MTDAEIFCLYIPLRAFLWCPPSFRPCHKGALRSVHYLRQCHTIAYTCNVPKSTNEAHAKAKIIHVTQF